jgi:N-acetyl-gamma-glutamyl-phosphate reductase
MIKAGIVGGTGYTGVELLRLLVQHPEVELATITSRKEAGTRVDAMFPGLRGRVSLAFAAPDQAALNRCDVVFYATPNGVAMGEARALLDAGVRIIDLSADFRLQDVVELNRDSIKAARLVANPGCYPTAVQLGFLPLIEAGWIDTAHLIADAKSGVSGAGRKRELHLMYAEASDNFKAYGVSGHRHWPEIRQGLAQIAGRAVGLVFTPHLTPAIRGIHATLYARLLAPAAGDPARDLSALQSIFEQRYAAEPFVDVMPAGSHPDTRAVRGANLCRIAVHRPNESADGGDTVVVLSVIDNLVKGASGQAVQNMNIMFGFPEAAGLGQLPIVP